MYLARRWGDARAAIGERFPRAATGYCVEERGMSAAIMESRLLIALGTDADLSASGCAAEAGEGAGIIIRHGEHYRGAWSWQSGAYAFTPAGYSQFTCQAQTIDEAVIVTRQLALR